jgi:hypothetical protein
MALGGERFGEGTNNITQSSRAGERRHFGRHKQNLQGGCHWELLLSGEVSKAP